MWFSPMNEKTTIIDILYNKNDVSRVDTCHNRRKSSRGVEEKYYSFGGDTAVYITAG